MATFTKCATITRITEHGESLIQQDVIVIEQSIKLIINRETNITMLATPSDLEALAIGASFSFGVIENIDDVVSVSVDDIPIANKFSGLAQIDSSSLEFPLGGDESSLRSVLDIHDSSEQGSQQRGKPKCEEYNDKENITIQLEVKNNKSPASLKDLVVVSSKGAGNILYAANTQNLSRPLANKLQVTSSLLPKVIDQLKKSQVLFYETGGTHAAGIFDKNGEIIAFAEDIGRHNALDKAIGKCLLAYKNTNGLGVVLSSRLSFEMVAKAYRAGLELVVAVSAPTSLAVDAADKWNMTLCGFVRNQQANIYTHSERVILIQ